MLIELSRESPCMISTGYDTVLSNVNRELMRNMGVIILIDRPLDQILSDIKLDDRRPNLIGQGLGEVERLYADRIGVYRGAADLTMVNDGSYYSGVSSLERLLKTRFRIDGPAKGAESR